MAVELDIQGGPVGPSHAHANIFTISTDSKGRALVNHGVALITCNLFFGFTFKWALPLFNNTNDSILYAVIHMEPEYFLIFVGLLPLLLSYVWYMYVLFCAWLMILIIHQGVTTDLEIIWNNVSAPSFGLTNKSEWIHVASKCFSVFLKSWFRKKKKFSNTMIMVTFVMYLKSWLHWSASVKIRSFPLYIFSHSPLSLFFYSIVSLFQSVNFYFLSLLSLKPARWKSQSKEWCARRCREGCFCLTSPSL